MDYGKMKVIELRAELQARGLDTKGDLFDFVSIKKFS
jgi:SAP domain